MLTMTKAEAIAWLTRRWHEQVNRFPLMREQVPLELYLRRNVRYLLAHAVQGHKRGLDNLTHIGL